MGATLPGRKRITTEPPSSQKPIDNTTTTITSPPDPPIQSLQPIFTNLNPFTLRRRASNVTALNRNFRKSNTSNKHISIRYCRLRSRRVMILQNGAHKPLEIVDKAIRSFDRPVEQWSATQRLALRDWARWWAKWKGPEDGTKPMLEAIGILGRIFFLGKLRRCTFRWTEEILKTNAIGQTRRVGMAKMEILLVPRVTSLARYELQDSRIRFVSVLLHECVHAFIMLYSCGWECQHEACMAAYKADEGWTGHGWAWVSLATAVQRISSMVFSLDITVGVLCRGTLQEFKATQYNLDNADWCRMEGLAKAEWQDYLARIQARRLETGNDAARDEMLKSRVNDLLVLDPDVFRRKFGCSKRKRLRKSRTERSTAVPAHGRQTVTPRGAEEDVDRMVDDVAKMTIRAK
ncbi:hypothetical protein B0A50_06274 [Salinomyces thailandicus]|uniref:SprT-like domain-containing protein n=1 Tax=Salinomyces thailandicus TaxID=706561 RepID=A0A4U0TTD9_9PEZI|nr:hypothetical protein B0A50_06274 [Salinomyces thailandica]